MKNKILLNKVMIAVTLVLLLSNLFTLEEDLSLWRKALRLGVPVLLMASFIINLNHYKKQNPND